MNNNKKVNENNINNEKKLTTRVFARVISTRREMDKIAGGQKCSVSNNDGRAQFDCIYE